MSRIPAYAVQPLCALRTGVADLMDKISIGMVCMGTGSLRLYDTGAALRPHCKMTPISAASAGPERRIADRRTRGYGVGVRLRQPNVE